jgi:hypothetical protein
MMVLALPIVQNGNLMNAVPPGVARFKIESMPILAQK